MDANHRLDIAHSKSRNFGDNQLLFYPSVERYPGTSRTEAVAGHRTTHHEFAIPAHHARRLFPRLPAPALSPALVVSKQPLISTISGVGGYHSNWSPNWNPDANTQRWRDSPCRVLGSMAISQRYWHLNETCATFDETIPWPLADLVRNVRQFEWSTSTGRRASSRRCPLTIRRP